MSESQPKPSPGKKLPPLEIPPDLEPLYTNLVRISHSPSEMIFDFARILPGSTQAEVKTRVLMSPLSAKLLHHALGENISKYESNFGVINVPGTSSLAEHLFRPPQPPEE